MAYGKIRVTIKGLSPLLMHRLDPESLRKKATKRQREYIDEEEAKRAAYMTEVDGEEQLYIPGRAVYSMIIQTSKQYKVKRTSLSSLLAGTIRIEPEKILLGTNEYEIDVQPVRVQRARVLRARPKIPEWEVTFTIIYDKDTLTSDVMETLKTILIDGGKRVGLLDFRPQNKGPFGTFEVTAYEVETD